MKTVWTKGLDSEKEDHVRQEFIASPTLRNRVKEILQEKLDVTLRTERSKDALDSPNWAIKQAYHMGYEKAIEEILNLF